MLKQEAATRERQVPLFLKHGVGPPNRIASTDAFTDLCNVTGVGVNVCCQSCMQARKRGHRLACLLQVDDLMRALDRLQTLQSEAKTAAVHARVREGSS